MNSLEVIDVYNLGDGRAILSGRLQWASPIGSRSDVQKAVVGHTVSLPLVDHGEVSVLIQEMQISETMGRSVQAGIGVTLPPSAKVATPFILHLGSGTL